MRKKFLIALLTVTMFTCALMTGCGSENEVVEPKNDKEVVTEESNNAELSEVEQMEESSEIEESIVDETIEPENTISLATALQILDKTNGAYIYTAKMLKSDDNRIDENTLLHVFKLDITNSKATKMLTNDASIIRLKDISEMLSSMTEDNANIFDAGLLPIYNRSNEGELETMASALLTFDYDSMSGEELITYFGNKIEYVEISGVKYVMFTTDTVEEETEYSYYTLINMSDFAENTELQLPDMPDDDPNAGCINGLPSNYGGLTDCDPSVESDDIRTTYTTNDMILVE